MIEGEGLGGFARRLTVNASAEGLFRPRDILRTAPAPARSAEELLCDDADKNSNHDGQPQGDTSGQGGIGMLPKYLLLSKKKAAVQHARRDQTIMLLARLYKHGWR